MSLQNHLEYLLTLYFIFVPFNTWKYFILYIVEDFLKHLQNYLCMEYFWEILP